MTELPSSRPHWSGEINLGHVTQAVIILVGVVFFITSIKTDIASQQNINDQQNIRIALAEKSIDSIKSSDEAFRAEMRAKLEQILVGIADVRNKDGKR